MYITTDMPAPMPKHTPTSAGAVNRRHLLQLASAASSCWAAPMAWAQTARTSEPQGRLVVVFLRGAYDGLSALVPHGDANYYAIRPTIALPKPDGTLQTTLMLDATFGLHPAFNPLMPLWQQGVLAVVPAAGSPDPTRSHFDAQHHWEIGRPGISSNAAGWMNTLAGFGAETLVGSAQSAPNSIAESPVKSVAIGVGEANPQILAGSAPVQLVAKGEAAKRQGALGDKADTVADHRDAHAVRRQQHNPRPLPQPVLRLRRTRQALKLGTFLRRQNDNCRLRDAAHASLNHDSFISDSGY